MRESDSNNVSKKKNVSKKGNQVDQSVIDLAKKIEKVDPAFEPEALYSKKYAANLFDDDELLGSEYSDDSDELDDSDFEVDKQILKEQDKNKKSSKGKSNSNEEVLINFDDDNTSENIFNVNEEELDIKLNENKATKKGKAISRDSKKVENEVNNINNDDYGFMKDLDDDNEPEKEDEKVEENKGIIAGNEAPKAPKSYEEQKRESFLKTSQEFLDDFNDPYDKLLETYGKKGVIGEGVISDRLEEYNEIEINSDELDDKVVTALMLGALTKKGRLLGIETGNNYSNDNDKISFNATHLIHDIPVKHDSRDGVYVPAMIEARKEVKSAVEAYSKGDHSMVNALLNNFVNFTYNSNSSSYGDNSVRVNAQTTLLPNTVKISYLANDILQDKRFEIKESEGIDKFKTKALIKEIDAKLTAEKNKGTLIKAIEDNALNDEFKSSMVEEILFNDYIAHISQEDTKEKYEKKSEVVRDIFAKYGFDVGEEKDGINIVENISTNYAPIILSENKLIGTFGEKQVGKLTAILSADDGKEQLKEKYLDEIRKTDIYKKMMAADTKEKMIDAIMEEEKVTYRGLSSFKNVELSSEIADQINEMSKQSVNNVIKSVRRDIEGELSKNHFWEEYNEFGFTDVEADGLKRNAQNINKMYDDIKAVNKWTSSPNFEAVVTALKDLKEYSEELAKDGIALGANDREAYNKKVKAVEEAASHYLDNKTNINSNYAKSRFLAVGTLRRRLNANKTTLHEKVDERVINEQERILGTSVGEKYSINGNTMLNVMKGEKNKNLDIKKLKSSADFSVYRAALQSYVVYSLVNQGHSIDDIMDSDKLKDIKEAEFDKAKELMLNVKEENKIEMAKNYYEGFKKMDKLVDDYVKEIDFNKSEEELLKDPKFNKFAYFSHARFDGWQEMSHIKDAMVQYAGEKEGVNNWEDLKNALGKNIGSATKILKINDDFMDGVLKAKTNKEPSPNTMGQLVQKALTRKAQVDFYKSVMNDKNKTFVEIEKDSYEKMGLIESAIVVNDDMRKLCRSFSSNTKLSKYLVDKIADGSFFKNVQVEFYYKNNMLQSRISNLPTQDEIFKAAEREQFYAKSDAALERLNNKKYDNSKDFIKDSALAITGQLYKKNGDFLTSNGVPVKPEKFAETLMKSKSFAGTLKNSTNPTKWKSGKDMYKAATNDNVLNSILQQCNNKFVKAPEVKAAPKVVQKNVKPVGLH
ncbi:MAG: hypothetical protein K6G11_05205 [Lachnospiraceae bacterium]|nr:hypothetical protein [Lachnospiraceae bacterium]